MIKHCWKTVTAFLVSVIIATTSAGAKEFGPPKGPVILTVTGAIARTNTGDSMQFDLAMLEAMDSTEIETTTIWTEGLHSFKGVSLVEIIDVLGVTSGTLLAEAVNDYAVEIPVTDAVTNGPIIAYQMDGETMTLRNKGPLWLVYPYDQKLEYKSEVIYTRSIWHLDRIEVVQ